MKNTPTNQVYRDSVDNWLPGTRDVSRDWMQKAGSNLGVYKDIIKLDWGNSCTNLEIYLKSFNFTFTLVEWYDI